MSASEVVSVGLLLSLALPTGAQAQRLGLPPRPPDAPVGSDFARSVEGLDLEVRDERIVAEILAGNVPDWLRELRPARIEGEAGNVVELHVTPDYLAVGSASDYLLVPMTPRAAQRIADSLGMSLPTPKIVDAIWRHAALRLTPDPIPPSPAMTTVPVFLRHSDAVRAARREAEVSAGSLAAGHKKDVVVCAALAANPGRVAIYGWHEPDGEPIQPLYLGHTDDWVDYSHGIRLVSRAVLVDGEPLDLWEVLRDPALAQLLSGEGPIDEPRYPRYDGDPTSGGSRLVADRPSNVSSW